MDGSQSSRLSPRVIRSVIAVMVLLGLFFLGARFTPQLQEASPSTSSLPTGGPLASLAPSTVSVDDDVILGDVDAPVTIIEFGDYQCPFCKTLYTNAELAIRNAYVAKGLVRFVYRDFPLDRIHPYARAAAEAAQCASDQNKYWEYHDYLFEHQEEIPSLDFVTVAQSLGLDMEQFSLCVTSRKYRAEVEKDYQDGIAAGVTGTPTTFVNGVMVQIGGKSAGAASYSLFQAKIEEALQSFAR